MTFKTIFVIASLVALSQAASGQTSESDSTLRAANRLYNAGSYESAELMARRLIEQGPKTDSIRIEADRIIAFSLVAEGKPDMAREHFKLILSMNPSFELDPILTSPKILTVFAEAKLHSAAVRKASTAANKEDKPALSDITFRTILFPGWEQYHQRRINTGLVLAGAGVLSLGSAITFEILRAPARRDYLAATQPADIASQYIIYNRYYRGEVYSIIAFAAVYIASELDVFLNSSQSLEIHSSSDAEKGPALILSVHW